MNARIWALSPHQRWWTFFYQNMLNRRGVGSVGRKLLLPLRFDLHFVVNYHYGESWRRSGNTHPRASKKTLREYYWNNISHHYGAELSFHRSASQRNAALVLVRAYVTPWTRPKPPINAFKWSSQGITPIYSRSAFYDYSCRCLLCSDTPVTDLINFALASLHLPPTKRTEIDYMNVLKTKEGFILNIEPL